MSVRAISDLERGAPHAPRKDTVQMLADALALTGGQRTAFEQAARALRTSTFAPTAGPAAEVRTFLIADVRGYTSFTHQHGDEAAARLASRFAAITRERVTAWDGQVIELRGDEALVVFASARQALRAALALQDGYAEEARVDPSLPVRVGIGLDTGEAIPVELGYRGAALNLAARLCALAGPGEVLATEAVTHLAGRLEGLSYVERGATALKGIPDPVRLVEIVPERPAQERPAPQQPVPRPSVRPRPRRKLSPLYGRAEEVRILEDHLQTEGAPLLILAGEPGIGKTRLLQEAMELAGREGMTVLHGECQRRSGHEPYVPLTDALLRSIRSLSQAEAAETLRDCAWLARVLPELAGLISPPTPPATIASEQERRLVFDAATRYLAKLTEPSGLLLVLDDMQWATADAIDLLSTLVRDPALEAMQVVAAYRDTEVQAGHPLAVTLADLAHGGLARRVKLEPLSEGAARELLASMVAAPKDAAGAPVERVIRSTGGVPFYLMSYAQELRTAPEGEQAAADVPWSVAQSVQQRLNALPAGAQEVLRVASAVGRTVPRPVLAAVVERPEAEVLDALDSARQAHLLVEASEDAYQFAHDVIREVIEAALGAARRSVLHRSIAQALETGPGQASSADLAYHYARSDKPQRALTYLVQTADRAHAAAAYHEETDLLGQAIDIALRTGQADMVPELRARRGRAFFTAAMWNEADAEYQAALSELAPEQRAQVLVDLAVIRHWLLDVPGTHGYAREALALAEEMGRNDLAAAAMAALALAFSSDGDLQQSVQQYHQAYLHNGKRQIIAPSAGAELNGLVLYWLADYDASIALDRAVVKEAEAIHDITTVARALGNLGMALAGTGRYAEAQDTFLQARDFARERNLKTWLARATAMHGGLHLEVFDFVRAEELAQEAREISRCVNWGHAVISGGIDLLLNYARRGEVGRIEGFVDEVAEGVAHGQGAHGWLWRLRFAQARAEIALARNDSEDALRWAANAIEHARKRGRIKYEVAGLRAQAQALTSLGRTKEAIVDLRAAVERARPTGDPVMFLRPAASLLALDGDDALLSQAQEAASAISAGLPLHNMRRCFSEADPVRLVSRLTARTL